MAIVGLQNVPILDSSFLREPISSSPSSSGQHGNQGRPNSRASSILQMWRELEDECLTSRANERSGIRLQNESNDAPSSSALSSNVPPTQDSENRLGLEGPTENENLNGTSNENSMESQTEQEDHNSMTSEQSQDLGEAERERVRQIFREWMNSGGNGLTSNSSSMNSSPRAQFLGRTELERIRVVREWIQTACEQRDNCSAIREDQATEIGSQIERVREGLILDQSEGPTDNGRRDIRRLCGRQALLDLLANNKRERERELQALLEHCPVSSFPFRNRIQPLLRIRLLHNRSIEHSRTNSAAESELGVLRQRHSVSGLREGFLSRFDNSVHVQSNDHSSGPCDKSINGSRGNETQPNSSDDVVANEREQINPIKEDNSGTTSFTEDLLCGSEMNAQGDAGLMEASLVHECYRQELGPEGDENRIWQVIPLESFSCRDGGLSQIEEMNLACYDCGDEEPQPHNSLSFPDTVEFSRMSDPENSNDGHRLIIFQEAYPHENVEHSQDEETHDDAHEQHDHYDPYDVSPHLVDLEDQGSEAVNVRNPASHQNEQVAENADQECIGGSLPNERTDGSLQEMDEEWLDSAGDEQTDDSTPGNEGMEQNQLLESSWHEGGSQQPPRSWLALPSEPGVSPAGSIDMHYNSYDDNVHSIELRELSSRRRVSSLLRSGFRESLNQILQSYVERQSHAPEDWELHEMLPTPFVVHDENAVNTNQNEDSSDVDEHSDVFQSIPFIPQRNWEQDFHDIYWSRDVHQRPGTELEMINDLRIEMARLQQRMNNIQRMLEACMDMQVELQRSVRQEVSAALNRSINSSEPAGDAISRADSKWDSVRRGICCACGESKLDSLLYRCGHMCTCAKCATALVEGKGKCPMCEAPVVEVIRTYTLQ